jgi:membrane glycosyltransferase
VSSALWFGFIALSTTAAILQAVREPVYFPEGRSLFPQWPVWRPEFALSLAAVTLAILFLPKILAVVLAILKRHETRGFGGLTKLVGGTFFEIVIASLLAPIRMVFHSRFVLLNLLGREVSWRSQWRGDRQTSWGDALRAHGTDTLVASAWGIGVFWLNPTYFFWVMPIVAALVLSIPISVLSSRVRLGEWARRRGWFAIPEESDPPQELRDRDEELARARAEAARRPPAEADGFVRAAVDPFSNAIHAALQRAQGSLAPRIRAARRALLARAVERGPGALSRGEKAVLLSDRELVDDLHREVWSISDPERAAAWGRPGQAGR